jgi:hypothetical protein
VLNDVFIAHHDRAAAVDNRTHCQFRLERHTDLAREDQVERRLERRSNLRRDGNSTAGSARIVGSRSLYPASATASLRPASQRLLNGMMFSTGIPRRYPCATYSFFLSLVGRWACDGLCFECGCGSDQRCGCEGSGGHYIATPDRNPPRLVACEQQCELKQRREVAPGGPGNAPPSATVV